MKQTLILIGVLAIMLTACSNRQEYTVHRKNLVQAVYASGEVNAKDYYQITSKIPGIVDTIYVSIGQTVAAGDPLLKIKSQTNQLNLQTARNLYELAKKNASSGSELLESLRQKVEAAYESYQLDSVTYERYKRLNEQNIGAKQDLDRAKLAYQTSQSNYLIAKSDLQETRDRLRIEMKNAENNYRAQQSQLGDYTLAATISGKVYDLLPETGELVNPNMPIIELGAAEDFEVELLVDETDIILIREDQSVIYELDALEDTIFRGKIFKIYPKINPVDKTAKVLATIDPIDYDLYPGMSLEANIIIQEKKEILAIPVEYLTTDNTVILIDDSKEKIVEVQTGIRDLEFAEILGGLQENDRIIKP